MAEDTLIQGVATSTERNKAIRIMANSMFRQFMSSGYSQSHIIDFTSELLQILTESLRSPTPADKSVAGESLAKEMFP